MLGGLFKIVRGQSGLSLVSLAEKINSARGSNRKTRKRMFDSQLSRYETGKTKLTEDVCMEIFTLGFDMPYSEAKRRIAEFKIKEARETLGIDAIARDVEEVLKDPDYASIIDMIDSRIFGKKKGQSQEEDIPDAAIYQSLEDYINKAEPVDHIRFDFFTKQKPKNLFITTVSDDCMNPTIEKNDKIIVLKTVSPPENDKIYIVNQSLRRFKTIGDINLTLD